MVELPAAVVAFPVLEDDVPGVGLMLGMMPVIAVCIISCCNLLARS